MEGGEALQLCLSPLSGDDPFFSKKMELLSARNLSSEIQVPLHSSTEELLRGFDRLVQSARILLLDEVELYFVEDGDPGPFSPRNELESLSSILSMIDLLFASSGGGAVGVLRLLKESALAMISKVGANCTDYGIDDGCDSSAEESLLRWGEEQGMKTKLSIHHFRGAGRGAVALQDIDIGVTALEIPESLIIHEDLLYESEMFDILKNSDGITAETMMLLWSMKERYDPDSRFKIYFDTLPKEFKTGLSFGIDALAALEGTVLFEEILQAKEHLRNQYDALCPALCTHYPSIFQPELYAWDQFLWACELWYSNSMKIVFADGKVRTCLVPIAGLLNHSICPHILRYGKVDPETSSLRLNVSRPCKEGKQCYLSYGSFPSSHLVTFYGFLPREIDRNPYDVIPLDFEAPLDDEVSKTTNGKSIWNTHMIRGTWMAKNKGPSTYGLPQPLLDHLRSVLKVDSEETPEVCDQMDIVSGWVRPHSHICNYAQVGWVQRPHSHIRNYAQINKETERAVLETILSIFNPVVEGLGVPDDLDSDGAAWDVKLALDFKDLHRRIVSSVLASCSAGLQMLDSL